jgi:hypothetical protein
VVQRPLQGDHAAHGKPQQVERFTAERPPAQGRQGFAYPPRGWVRCGASRCRGGPGRRPGPPAGRQAVAGRRPSGGARESGRAAAPRSA